MKSILQLLKKILGKKLTKLVRPLGHGLKARLASIYYGFPANKLKLVGITGTKGKTTTTVLTGKLMNKAGFKTGYISTAFIYDGKKEYINPHKMGTIDSVIMFRVLRKMLQNGCTHAVLELTSQGLEQNRHWGLGLFEGSVLTNLYPEHLEAHGGWRPYLKAKSRLLALVKRGGFMLVNEDPQQYDPTQEILSMLPLTYLPQIELQRLKPSSSYNPKQKTKDLHKDFVWQGKSYQTKLISEPEILDLFFATKIVQQFDPYLKDLKIWLSELTAIPGRMEFVVLEGKVQSGIIFSSTGLDKYKSFLDTKESKLPITIMVDYAHEPASMEKLLLTLSDWREQKLFDKVIHVLSNDGAGRDDWKKPVMGDLSFKHSDFTIVTTDNYDEEDDPKEILRLQSQNFDKKLKDKKYILEVNRKKAFKTAIQKASKLAKQSQKVILVSTGVGTEDGLTQPGGVMDWDERGEWLGSWYEFVSGK
jgi:UDP-N-acetylmuramoyl-L-alanyl-D-glutamate--2,6-diaminopimelate ligase